VRAPRRGWRASEDTAEFLTLHMRSPILLTLAAQQG
jgi:hypothetical protein